MSTPTPHVIDPLGRQLHAETARIRAAGPVVRVVLPGGIHAWSVTGYAEARRLLADPRVSRDAYQHWPAFIQGEIPPDWPLITWVASKSISNAYGDEHTRLRALLAAGFTRRRIEALRPSVERITGELLDGLAGAAPGEVVDLRARYAHALPARVACDLLGVPHAFRGRVDEVTSAIAYAAAGPSRTATAPGPDAGEDATTPGPADFRRMATDLIAVKRRQPGDDLLTALLQARDEDGSRLSEEELESTVLTLLRAGHVTVLALISNAVTALLRHPEQRASLTRGTAGWDDVIEETLRVDSPVEHLPLHYAVTDIEIAGVTITRGEPILMGFGAAGRDPRLHGPTAEEFDVTRENKQHLSFGHGVHHCIGAPLGRMQARVALPALFAHFPDLALAVPVEELEPTTTFMLSGHRTLPVRLTPAR
ncbi:cytochrome P450 [Streptomyces sp. CSDS2]|uniref:cytochrome P450 family protein n=1 Tax=Streptomyces sp. CSDS2 TaxID=3055051 RepID=UPI0025B026E3|nr:cytochrome P450 [Streptomyces sp. CSDS2]MDN3259857.1 cytochrome P450 [Streptomyces sp. CSDS2]